MKQKFNYFRKASDSWTIQGAMSAYAHEYGENARHYLIEDLFNAKRSTKETHAARASELLTNILDGLGTNLPIPSSGGSGSISTDSLSNNNNNDNDNVPSTPACTVRTGTIINHGVQSIGAPVYNTSGAQVNAASSSSNYNNNKRRRSLLHENDESEEQDSLEQYFNRHNNSNPISDDLTLPPVRDSLNRMDKVDIGNIPNSKYEYKVNNTDMSAKFYGYKQEAKSILSNQKYFQESHLHEMLAITHILLLKKGEYPPTMLQVFDEVDLDDMTKELRKKFIAGDEFDKNLKAAVEELLKGVDDYTEEELQDVADEINNMAHEARKQGLKKDSQILKCLRNMFENLPYTALGVEPSEADLVTSFLEQLLRPLLSSRKSRLRWPNAKAEVTTSTATLNRTTSNRPDAKVSNMCGINYGEARAFGEVKPIEHAKDNYLLAKDLLRLCVFGKDSVDKDHMYATMLFQAVGHSITFYASTLVADGMYVDVELETIKFPESLKELKLFSGSLNGVMNVLNCFEKCSVDNNNKQRLEDMARDTLDTPSFRNIIDPTKSKTRLRYVNFI